MGRPGDGAPGAVAVTGRGPVVEVGCGPSTDEWLGADGIDVAVDRDLGALRRQRPTGGGRPRVCGDARRLPFRSASCSGLVLNLVLHHLGPTRDALCEMSRVLRASGRLHLADGVALTPEEAADLDQELRDRDLPGEPVYGFDLDRLRPMLEEVGLQVVECWIDGKVTFATPPYVSRSYTTDRFIIVAERRGRG